MRHAITAAVLLLALTACSSPSASPAPSATPTMAASPSARARAAQTYDGAQRLVGGLNEAGVACLNWERTEDPIGATERGSCYVGTEEVVTSIYASHAEVVADADSKQEMLANIGGTHMVLGGNWALSCDSEALCADIVTRFGGTAFPAR